MVEEEREVEVETKTEYIYEDTKCISGIEPEYHWGEIYRLITRREVPNIGLEEESIYANIARSALMKVATRPELFPCSEVIGWIFPRADTTTMIIENVEGQGYAAFSPGYVALAYHLPEAQVFLSDDWLNNIRMDLVETLKRMMLQGKHYQYRLTSEYDTVSLRAPYRFIALMLNRIFGRAHGRLFKFEWIPIMFHVATQGTVFNWASLVSSSLSSCMAAALGGESRRKYEFYMSSILIDYILCNQPFPGLRCI